MPSLDSNSTHTHGWMYTAHTHTCAHAMHSPSILFFSCQTLKWVPSKWNKSRIVFCLGFLYGGGEWRNWKRLNTISQVYYIAVCQCRFLRLESMVIKDAVLHSRHFALWPISPASDSFTVNNKVVLVYPQNYATITAVWFWNLSF